MTSREDFNDRELVPDAIVGVRRFNVDRLGRLCAVSASGVWRPGINEAKCNADRMGWNAISAYYRTGLFGNATDTTNTSASAVPMKKEHRCGSKNCNCGFYAFFTDDPNNHGYQPGQLTGIIEGSGVATVGTKGFRVERAEIVALVWPKPPREHPLLDRLGRFATNLRNRVDDDDDRPDPKPVPWHLIFRNYPEISVYRTLDAATREHPLSQPMVPEISPGTCDDFWTRP